MYSVTGLVTYGGKLLAVSALCPRGNSTFINTMRKLGKGWSNKYLYVITLGITFFMNIQRERKVCLDGGKKVESDQAIKVSFFFAFKKISIFLPLLKF